MVSSQNQDPTDGNSGSSPGHPAQNRHPLPIEPQQGLSWSRLNVPTDLAVRVGEVATAVKIRIMAILQRSAAEPVDTKGSV